MYSDGYYKNKSGKKYPTKGNIDLRLHIVYAGPTFKISIRKENG